MSCVICPSCEGCFPFIKIQNDGKGTFVHLECQKCKEKKIIPIKPYLSTLEKGIKMCDVCKESRAVFRSMVSDQHEEKFCCKKCQVVIGNFLKNGVIFQKLGGTDEKFVMTCNHHFSPLTYYCKTCRKEICDKCFDEHSTHEYLKLADLFSFQQLQNYQSNIKETSTLLEQKVYPSFESFIKYLHSFVTEVENRFNECKENNKSTLELMNLFAEGFEQTSGKTFTVIENIKNSSHFNIANLQNTFQNPISFDNIKERIKDITVLKSAKQEEKKAIIEVPRKSVANYRGIVEESNFSLDDEEDLQNPNGPEQIQRPQIHYEKIWKSEEILDLGVWVTNIFVKGGNQICICSSKGTVYSYNYPPKKNTQEEIIKGDYRISSAVSLIDNVRESDIVTSSQKNQYQKWELKYWRYNQDIRGYQSREKDNVEEERIEKIIKLSERKIVICTGKLLKIFETQDTGDKTEFIEKQSIEACTGKDSSVNSIILTREKYVISCSKDMLKIFQLNGDRLDLVGDKSGFECPSHSSMIQFGDIILVGGRARINIIYKYNDRNSIQFKSFILVDYIPEQEIFSMAKYSENSIICGTEKGDLFIVIIENPYEPRSWKVRIQHEAHTEEINSILMLEGRKFMTCSTDGTVKLWTQI